MCIVTKTITILDVLVKTITRFSVNVIQITSQFSANTNNK